MPIHPRPRTPADRMSDRDRGPCGSRPSRLPSDGSGQRRHADQRPRSAHRTRPAALDASRAHRYRTGTDRCRPRRPASAGRPLRRSSASPAAKPPNDVTCAWSPATGARPAPATAGSAPNGTDAPGTEPSPGGPTTTSPTCAAWPDRSPPSTTSATCWTRTPTSRRSPASSTSTWPRSTTPYAD